MKGRKVGREGRDSRLLWLTVGDRAANAAAWLALLFILLPQPWGVTTHILGGSPAVTPFRKDSHKAHPEMCFHGDSDPVCLTVKISFYRNEGMS